MWYITSVQPSIEMHWKMVSHAHAMLSNEVIPKFGKFLISSRAQYCPIGHFSPEPPVPWFGYVSAITPLQRSSVLSSKIQSGFAGSAHVVGQLANPETASFPHASHPLMGLYSSPHRFRNRLSNNCTPMMPKMKNRKLTSTSTSKSMGSDCSSVLTSARMPLTPVIVRSGRRTRTVRIPEKLSTPGRYARSPSTTTVKSMRFHQSLR